MRERKRGQPCPAKATPYKSTADQYPSNGPKPPRANYRSAQPLVVELELYFSCLIKKFVHFHETAPQRDTVPVSDKLAVFFRPVTSTACSFEVADRLGRQPEIELDTPNVRKIAPKRVSIDYVRGVWKGQFWI